VAGSVLVRAPADQLEDRVVVTGIWASIHHRALVGLLGGVLDALRT
jgi:hypothetical protein